MSTPSVDDRQELNPRRSSFKRFPTILAKMDTAGTESVVDSFAAVLNRQLPPCVVDMGYDFQEVREPVIKLGSAAQMCSRGEKAKALWQRVGYRARSGVAKRSHSRFNRCPMGQKGNELSGVLACGLPAASPHGAHQAYWDSFLVRH